MINKLVFINVVVIVVNNNSCTLILNKFKINHFINKTQCVWKLQFIMIYILFTNKLLVITILNITLYKR